MKTTEEKIAVMQAYVNGKEIEVRMIQDEQWTPAPFPRWDWEDKEYRVKPKSEYRPYDNSEEVIDDMKLHGPMCKEKESGKYMTIIEFDDEHILLNRGKGIFYGSLLVNFVWQDGTPFGRKVE